MENGIQNFIMGIIGVAVILAVGLIVLGEFSDSVKTDSTSAGTNETVTLTISTDDVNTGTLSQSGLYVSVSACRNASLAEEALTLGTLGTANCSVSNGIVTVNSSTVNTTSVRVDYTYYTPDAAYNATNQNITKLATIPTWIGILITVALAFIILGYFYGNRQ